ncbi:MAG TPA: alkaline phosphatase family protein [Pyrinomonadaceae bacterium]|nr:alkaline phosphatase family protein [Pyrinomonadaceae bacterium]
MALKRRDFLKRLSTGIAGAAAFIGLGKAGIAATKPRTKRLVLIKIDGLPHRLVDEFANEIDPETGKSRLPWIKHVFYENGARLNNFYVRGMSLSASSWSLLDTGQHLQIKGNVEFDRLTLHAYDYLNFIPFYVENIAQKHVDMAGVEVLEDLGTPLLVDAYRHEERYQSFQLYQRGVHWSTFKNSVKTRLERFTGAQDVIDEWTTNGFEIRRFIQDQLERDLIDRLSDERTRYLDYYTTDVDHRTHHNRDRASQLAAIRDVDATVGRIWTAIEKSSLQKETVLVLISDHGTNTDPNIISQGFNLVKLLGSTAGGGHHVITKRRLMMDYSLKAVYPFVPLITTTTPDSFYLKGQSTDYPTALLDFDGNERAAVHLRNSDLNLLHILLQQLKSSNLNPMARRAAAELFFATIDRNRRNWQQMVDELNEELEALRTSIKKQQALVAALPTKWTQEDRYKGLDQDAHRESARLGVWKDIDQDYSKYVPTLRNLLALRKDDFDPGKLKIESVIAKGAMGGQNTIYQLQNYVSGLSSQGLTIRDDGSVDAEKSFVRVNYFPLIREVTVRNNVQAGVSNEPIEFIAARLFPGDVIGLDDNEVDEIVWLYRDENRQALVLSRTDSARELMLRYLPVSRLRQTSDGKISFTSIGWREGLPFRIWEDQNLRPPDEHELWLEQWHTAREWVAAIHRTDFSNCIVGIHEQFSRHETPAMNPNEPGLSEDERRLHRFRRRRRLMVEPDLLIHASNHWNFDVRGFNPGGNHGSFFRVSTHSTLMFAGGENTGIPKGVQIEEPYDSLDVMPTLLQLTGDAEQGRPNASLAQKGFRQFPGRIIRELF